MAFFRSAVFAALALLLAAWPAQAQRGGGLSSFPLLRMEASARAAGMGGAFSAVPDGGAAALFYHPALPDSSAHNTVAATYLNHLTDLNAGFLSYSRRVEGIGAASAGLRFFGFGEFEGYDERGYETGAFGASQVALTLGLARAWTERLRYGANVHVVYGSIEEAGATALAADLGLRYHLPGQDLTVSFAMHNLGTALDSYYATPDSLDGGTRVPADLRLGISKKLAHLPLRLSATGFNLNHLGQGPEGGSTFDRAMRHLALGAELTPVEVFSVRLGYGHRRHVELSDPDERLDTAGLSAGFGLSIQRISVDYAFSSWSSLGGLHQFGLRARL